MKILIVDDSKTMRQIVKHYLSKLDITDVHEASNGNDALRTLAGAGQFDLVITDWNMPGMDGLALLAAIKRSPVFGSTPVILASVEGTMSKIRQAIQKGAAGYLIKPFKIDALSRMIRSVTQALEVA